IVLGEPDPRFELPQEERWFASIRGKVRAYSASLRSGLATTLALLGTHCDRLVHGSSLTGRDWAAYLVHKLLDFANADRSCRLWASLRDVLPLLAEAAPEEFLDTVRAGVAGRSPLLREIFMDQGGDALTIEAPHTGLLWALENCVWSPIHFGQAVD